MSTLFSLYNKPEYLYVWLFVVLIRSNGSLTFTFRMELFDMLNQRRRLNDVLFDYLQNTFFFYLHTVG